MLLTVAIASAIVAGMDIETYLSPPGSVAQLAKDLEIAPSLVSQWKNKVRPIPLERCTAIEKATNGAVTRRDLRPDDWHLIWPELVKAAA